MEQSKEKLIIDFLQDFIESYNKASLEKDLVGVCYKFVFQAELLLKVVKNQS